MSLKIRNMIIAGLLLVVACKQVPLQVAVKKVPQHNWQQQDTISMQLFVTDSANYSLHPIIRITQQFTFDHFVGKLLITDSLKKDTQTVLLHLPLTNNKGQWNGNLVDNIYDYQFDIPQGVLLKKGSHYFSFTQEMATLSLKNILDIGIQIQKK